MPDDSDGMSRPPEMQDDGSVDDSSDAYREMDEFGDFKNKYWLPHFAGCLLWFSWLLLIPATIIGAALSAVDVIAVLFVIPMMFLGIYGGLGAIIGYYYDAKDLRKSNVGYRPRWWLWIIGHIILSPLITSPIYLIRRRQKVGSPTWSEMKSALLFWRSSKTANTVSAD